MRSEDEAAVEVAPAPPRPRPESAAVSRQPAGGSPCQDEIDKLVDRSLRNRRRRYFDKCGFCHQDWHGLPNKDGCQGSHLKRFNKKPKDAVIEWDKMPASDQ